MRTFLLLLILFVAVSAQAQFEQGKYWDCGFITATDPDSGPEVTYSITAGNTGGYFIIMPCSGIIKVDTAAYGAFTRYKTWNLTFKVSDPEGTYKKITGSIKLWKDNGIKRKPTVTGIP